MTFFDTCRRHTLDSAGYDIPAPFDIPLIPGQWTDVDLGVSLSDEEMECMKEHYGRDLLFAATVYPRSGLATKYGMRVKTTVGIIDRDYRNNIRASLTVEEPYVIRKGERALQALFIPILTYPQEVAPTAERAGGFGSTGA